MSDPAKSIDNAKCILITGATSGIGRALSLAIAELPSKPTVIASGRRKERLEELNKIDGIETVYLEVGGDLDMLKKSVDGILSEFPDIDTIILNAGIQHRFDFKKDVDMSKFAEELNVNYTSNVALITYFLPHFLKFSEQGRSSFIVTVTSGLGIVPGPHLLTYSASKAALRSFTTSLRVQLSDTKIHVKELIPPLVESELHDAYGKTHELSKFWMPLDEFTKAAVQGLRNGADYIPVGASVSNYQKFEAGKEEVLMERARQRTEKK